MGKNVHLCVCVKIMNASVFTFGMMPVTTLFLLYIDYSYLLQLFHIKTLLFLPARCKLTKNPHTQLLHTHVHTPTDENYLLLASSSAQS